MRVQVCMYWGGEVGSVVGTLTVRRLLDIKYQVLSRQFREEL